MKRLLIRKFFLTVYVLLLLPVAYTQERQAGSCEKVVLLGIGKSDQRSSTTVITNTLLSTDAARRAETGGLVEAKARVKGGNLIIEFADSLPAKSRTLMLVSNLPLDNIGEPFCMVKAGSYPIDYTQSEMGYVRLPLTHNAPLMREAHRRRPSKFWGGIG